MKACSGLEHRNVFENIGDKLDSAVEAAIQQGCELFCTGAMGELCVFNTHFYLKRRKTSCYNKFRKNSGRKFSVDIIPKRIAKDISAFAVKHGVQIIILFGSRARGNHTERSDVDIAVSGGDFDAFYWDVKENIHSLLTFDIVNMDDNISDDLKEEITKDGVTIYEKA